MNVAIKQSAKHFRNKPFFVISSLLYWSSMAPTGNIEVSKLDGTERRVVVKDIVEPTGIALLDGGKFTILRRIFISKKNT